MELSKADIKRLKSEAQNIKPKVLVGKYGLTDGTLQSIDEVLTKDELVKVKFLNNSTEIDETIRETLKNELEAELVQVIGRMVLFFREKPEDK